MPTGVGSDLRRNHRPSDSIGFVNALMEYLPETLRHHFVADDAVDTDGDFRGGGDIVANDPNRYSALAIAIRDTTSKKSREGRVRARAKLHDRQEEIERARMALLKETDAAAREERGMVRSRLLAERSRSSVLARSSFVSAGRSDGRIDGVISTLSGVDISAKLPDARRHKHLRIGAV